MTKIPKLVQVSWLKSIYKASGTSRGDSPNYVQLEAIEIFMDSESKLVSLIRILGKVKMIMLGIIFKKIWMDPEHLSLNQIILYYYYSFNISQYFQYSLFSEYYV